MQRLDQRLRKLEYAAARVKLELMTDDALMHQARAQWKAAPWGSRETVAAVLAKVLREPSAFVPVPTEKLPPRGDHFKHRPFQSSGGNHG